MASDRGAYRAISVVLLDGKDFQQLDAIARWVFVALKMNFGPAGIEVHYRRALAEQLSEQTGHAVADVDKSLDDLEAAGWLERDGNIVWIVRQLEFEPNMKPSDGKHRKSIQRHAMGLPRLPIVGRFIEAYPEWFPENEFTPPEGLASPSEGPSKALATTEDRRPKTEDREPRTESREARRSAEGPPEPRAKKSKPTKVALPDDWQPNAQHRQLAKDLGVSLAIEADRMRDWAASKGERAVDWDARFRNWLRKAAEMGGNGHQPAARNGRPPDPQDGPRNGSDRRLPPREPLQPATEESKKIVADTLANLRRI